jgi:hypothetical protein
MRGKCECTELNIEIKAENHIHNVIDVTFDNMSLFAISEVANGIFLNAKPGEFSSEEKLILGLKGQCAVACYLYDDYRKGLESVKYGEPDVYDILYHGYKIDVKTCRFFTEPDSWVAVPGHQFNNPKRRYPFYIACMRIKSNVIRILGFIDREHFEKVKVDSYSPLYSRGTARVEHLDDLTPIKNFMRGK